MQVTSAAAAPEHSPGPLAGQPAPGTRCARCDSVPACIGLPNATPTQGMRWRWRSTHKQALGEHGLQVHCSGYEYLHSTCCVRWQLVARSPRAAALKDAHQPLPAPQVAGRLSACCSAATSQPLAPPHSSSSSGNPRAFPLGTQALWVGTAMWRGKIAGAVPIIVLIMESAGSPSVVREPRAARRPAGVAAGVAANAAGARCQRYPRFACRIQ
jgi:hypothetical protein